jgi:hypothetical protein
MCLRANNNGTVCVFAVLLALLILHVLAEMGRAPCACSTLLQQKKTNDVCCPL